MRRMDERERQMVDELRSEQLNGRMSRREAVRRAVALGLSAPAISAIVLGSRVERAAAQDTGTPTVSLGSYNGRTLRVSIALAESEVPVFQDVVVGGFKNATGGDVEIIKIEAADVIKTLQAQVGTGNVQLDLLVQDNNSLAPLVSDDLVEQLPEAQDVMPAQTIQALIDVLKFND